ncbi:DNA cytosine methyltransferase [Kitasatospora sp. NBC_01246]|uniref:DNA cytosine methyltransferase n=1 Tax=Kitasatospora sp. NBC_01246 TaxID=2903570 RepID=UPI002E304196|nr:DNA cytosine methyltransferase [Kitasatospora sp. NBC_01246]
MPTPGAPDILDLFAGPGGWSEGLRRYHGLTDIGIEWDAAACQTRAAAGHPTVRADVAQIATAPMFGRIRRLIASPPCQAWSRAGKQLGLQDQPHVHQVIDDLARGRDTRAELLAECLDPRSLLAAEPMRYLHTLRPEDTVMEEVPDALPLFRHYAEILRGWGYSVWCGNLNAADFGVPQSRRRALLIASCVRTAQPPEPTHTEHGEEGNLFGESRARWVSMAEGVGWGATDRPAPTVTAGGGKTGGAEPFPTQARRALDVSRERGAWKNRIAASDGARITVREAGVLQSFPADYPWRGTQTKQYEQAGNAVPPLLAAHVAAAAFGLPQPQEEEAAAVL